MHIKQSKAKKIFSLSFFFILIANLHAVSWYISLGSTVSLNMASKEISAPSPVDFTFGAFCDIFPLSKNTFIPSASVFAGYYLWDDTTKNALPAEIEQRTAYTINALLDLPYVYRITAKNSVFSFGTGTAFLLRAGFLAAGVPETEKTDIKNINQWFYQYGRFFYGLAQSSWDYKFQNKWSMGLTLKYYVPVTQFLDPASPHPLHGSMLGILCRIGIPE
jgi:hypothetical protein